MTKTKTKRVFSLPYDFQSGSSILYGEAWSDGTIIKVGSCAATEEELISINEEWIGKKWYFDSEEQLPVTPTR